MGIGVSLAFMAIGAILAFALRVDLSGVNIQMVGWILILVGVISMLFTLKYTRPRRGTGRITGADPAYGDEPGTVVHEEHIIQDPPAAGRPSERVERVVEHPPGPSATHGQDELDPSIAQDPAYAQNRGHMQAPRQGDPPTTRVQDPVEEQVEGPATARRPARRFTRTRRP
ncbi:DUF6458 family protein [Actinomadura sp. WMMB 499]|uniref:DUF6458 family protein n=1 Tax=Actinomadura sp. WMMB 499 TaxID=1219491 RepID=UPI0012440D33|nr:DUF6458 family protein [Actinomadura sp. WMMB 499]QFG23160.1 hypothetical protein F7P10_20580 [Actinomadura sp. WMMB 499]